MAFTPSVTPIRPTQIGQGGNLEMMQSYADAVKEIQTAIIAGDIGSGGGSSALTPAQLLYFGAEPMAMRSGTVAHTPTGAPQTFAVIWPDGASGFFTLLQESTGFPGSVDSFKVTRITSTRTDTVTQPTITRDPTSGLAVSVPRVILEIVGGDPVDPPTAMSLTVSPGDGQLTINVAGGEGTAVTFALYRGTSATGTLLTNTKGTFVDAARTNGTTYNYFATASNQSGQVTASGSGTPAAVPTAPTGAPVLTSGTATTSTQPLSFTSVSNADRYNLQYKRSVDSTWVDATTTLTDLAYTVTGLNANTGYDYRVRAGNSVGWSSTWSNTVTATTDVNQGSITTFFADTFDGTSAAGSVGNGWQDLTSAGATTTRWLRDADRLGVSITSSTNASYYLMQTTPAPAGSVLRCEMDYVAIGKTNGAARPINIVLCATSTTNYAERYSIAIDPETSKWLIRKIVGGTTTVLSEGAFSLNVDDTSQFPAKLQVGFKTLSGGVGVLGIWWKGVELGTATDNTPLTGRYFGVSLYGSTNTNSTTNINANRVDNFKALLYP